MPHSRNLITSTDLELIAYPICPYAHRVAICLSSHHIPYTRTFVDVYAAGSAWWHELSPFGKVPLLRVDDVILYESVAILEYVAERVGALMPADPIARARVRALIVQADVIHGLVAEYFRTLHEDDFARLPKTIGEKLLQVNRVLADDPPLPSAHVSVLDAVYAALFSLLRTLENQFGVKLGPQVEPLSTWSADLLALPATGDTLPADYAAQLAGLIARSGSLLQQASARASQPLATRRSRPATG